ncbi:nucleolar protein 58-like [Oncorhynchus masou masou]|uniref:nucleolar protein 58-like n=1 Tax=Oncorhynchus masou masou TaxID=90313 RepID=UPI0031840A5B
MSLGLAHSLSRYKLKFSPDKVDTMIVQAISLLDDLDKELNNYIMRCREWYGWHFPEVGKIITDNLAYCKSVRKIGARTNVATTDLSEHLPEEVEAEVKLAAEISMGTEVSEEDIGNIMHLCDQVIEITEYRTQLYDYLKNRMMAMAPNLTVMVGELVGARLISHAGSLLNLARHPASIVQILGAEKALFRALKMCRDTPKYGLIYHASLLGQTSAKNKGKIRRISGTGKAMAYDVKVYDPSGDSTLPSVSKKRKFEEVEEEEVATPVTVKTKKSKKEPVEEPAASTAAEETPKKKKKKSKKAEEEAMDVKEEEATVSPTEESSKKKKKKKKVKEEEGD